MTGNFAARPCPAAYEIMETNMTEKLPEDAREKPVNVHIALVGRQTYPVFLGIMETHADHVILVCSDDTEREANHIADVIGAGVCEVVKLPPDNIHSVINGINDGIISRMSDNGNYNYTVDISGGLKLWTVLVYKLLSRFRNLSFIYVDQSETIFDFTHTSQRKARVCLDMDMLFKLYEAKVNSYTPLADFTGDDFRACSLIEEKIFSNREFIPVFDIMANPRGVNNRQGIRQDRFREIKEQDFNEKTYRLRKFTGSSLSYRHECKDSEENGIKLSHADITVKNTSRTYTVSMDAPHLRDVLFFAGWFDLFVAGMLAKWKPRSDIRLGVTFEYANRNRPQNEIDIIMNTGHRLLFVECKTSISDHTTELDKFIAAVRAYGGTGSMALFVSYFSIQGDALAKCQQQGILPFSIEDARKEFWEEKKCDYHDLTGNERKMMFMKRDVEVQRKLNTLLDGNLSKNNKK